MTTFVFPALSRIPAQMDWSLVSNTQVSQSPLTGSIQTLELPGARWQASFVFENLQEADASVLQAFLMQLRGQANRFTLYNFGRSVPRGTINLSGVTVNGAVSNGATSVTFAGCGNTKTLLRGDYFAVAGELKVVVNADKTSDAGGAMTSIAFEPPVRAIAGWSNAAAVTLDKPTATFVLSDASSKWNTRAPIITNVPIDCIEAFN